MRDSSMGDSDLRLLEISLIGAQDLQKPSTAASALRRTHAYAVAWVDPSTKLRTHVDRTGGENPTWNDKFLFRVPASSLSADSPVALHVEIRGAGYVADTLLGTVRFLIGNQRLLETAPGVPSFAAVGVRRPSGRLQGMLNIGMTILPPSHVSAVAAEALAARGDVAAVGYRDLMGENDDLRNWWRRAVYAPPTPSRTPARELLGPSRTPAREPLKEMNAAAASAAGEDEEEHGKGGGRAVLLCWLGFPRRIHLSPSDQNLRLAGQDSG